ncbi:MAG: hypothetical protein AAFV80_01815 [Bacteroidota bacterium]
MICNLQQRIDDSIFLEFFFFESKQTGSCFPLEGFKAIGLLNHLGMQLSSFCQSQQSRNGGLGLTID